MITSLEPLAQKFLANLERTRERMARAEQQLTSGLRVSVPSDDPDQIGDILQLRAELARHEQMQINLGRVKTQVDTSEQVLQQSVKVVERALALAAQAAGTTQTAQNRNSIAQEVRGLHENLINLSRTAIEGRYIFSGDQDQSAQYQVNLANTNGVDRLFLGAATRQIQDTGGLGFAIEKTAQDIFDSRNSDDTLAADNVYAAVNGLRVALEADDQPGIDAAMTSLRLAHDHLNGSLAFYGSLQRRIEGVQNASSKIKTQIQSALSARQDADIAAAILELNQSKIAEEAALHARARNPQSSLFDYLA